MSSTARDIDCGTDLVEENKELQRDLASLRVRTRTLLRALNDHSGRTLAVVGVFGRGETVDKVVALARIAEELDEVPAVRFTRDRAGRINGVEMALLERPPVEDHDAGFRTLAHLALGMAVVGDES